LHQPGQSAFRIFAHSAYSGHEPRNRQSPIHDQNCFAKLHPVDQSPELVLRLSNRGFLHPAKLAFWIWQVKKPMKKPTVVGRLDR
jgi:hypothetical protein